jgi:tetratricopeptide (TPR) repeat protein
MAGEHDGDSTFTLYRRGIELLAEADFEQATGPLEAATRRAPEKSSVREALGRAYFRCGRFGDAATEFEAVVDSHQVNDFAHFCLGRALAKTGETERPPSPGAGRQPAPRPLRLPLLPRPAGLGERRLASGSVFRILRGAVSR